MPLTVIVPQMVPAGFAGHGLTFNGMSTMLGNEVGDMAEFNRRYDGNSLTNIAFRDTEDDQYVSPAKLLELIARQVQHMGHSRKSSLPKRLRELANLGVPTPVVDKLTELERAGFSELQVVRAMLVYVSRQVSRVGSLTCVLDMIGSLFRHDDEYREVRQRVFRLLDGTTADHWFMDGQHVGP